MCRGMCRKMKEERKRPAPPVITGAPKVGYELGYIHATAAIMLVQKITDPDLSKLVQIVCRSHRRRIASQFNERLAAPPLEYCHLCRANDARTNKGSAKSIEAYEDGMVDGIASLIIHRIHTDDFDCSLLCTRFCEFHSKHLALNAGQMIGWNRLPSTLISFVTHHLKDDERKARQGRESN